MTDRTLSPLVSIILPTRNRAQFLSRALKSIRAQTYSHLEVIVVDEGSSDNTPEVVRGFSDLRIKYLRREVARGPGGARNAGVEAAEGELISFLDDDDEYLPDKLNLQVRALSESLASVGLVYSPVRTLRDGKATELFPSLVDAGNIFLQYLSRPAFPLSASLIRKSVVVPFDEKLTCLEDVDFYLKILQRADAIYVDTVCSLCHLDKKRKRVGEDLGAFHHSFRILEDRYFNDPADAPLVRAHADLLLHYAFRFLTLGHEDEMARDYFSRAFRVKKDRRRLFYRVLNTLGPGALKAFKPRGV